MRLFIQRPWVSIHSNYPSVHNIRVRCNPSRETPTVTVEIWAGKDEEQGIDSFMENGIMADLSLEQAESLVSKLQEAIIMTRGKER